MAQIHYTWMGKHTLSTKDYLFMEGKIASVVHSHPGGEGAHYAHGVHPKMWGQGWDYRHMEGTFHYHQAEIAGA